MDFLTQKIAAKQSTQPTNSKPAAMTDLNPAEIELILRLLQTTNFPVKDIEILYNAILKLQEQFKSQLTTQ